MPCMSETTNFNSTLRVRIPPSPTGQLHLGTARTALYNFLVARRYGGKFVFRLEDTDKVRSKPEYVDDIIDGLKWLGISWDEGPFRQSEHFARHKRVVEQLLEAGLAYECFCSSAELEEMKLAQREQNKAEGYDNRHRQLSAQEKEAFREAGRKPTIRFRLPDDEKIEWNDLVRGKMSVNSSDLGGDPVIAKENGDVLYNFAVVVDDNDLGITHIIRGEDHLHNTAKQIPLYQALGWPVPLFAHVPLILTVTREKLSKRKHGDIASIAMYRDLGYLPEAIVNYLVAMSWTNPSGEEVFTLDEAIPSFDLCSISRSAAVYDREKLLWFCKQHFQRLSSAEVFERAQIHLEAAKLDLSAYDHAELVTMVSLVKDGLTMLPELTEKLSFFFQPPTLSKLAEAERNFLAEDNSKLVLKASLDLLETIPVEKLLAELPAKTGLKKGRAIMLPLRLALTGEGHGPDLIGVLSLLGKVRVKERLERSLAE